MMRKNLTILAMLFLATLAITSCKKEDTDAEPKSDERQYNFTVKNNNTPVANSSVIIQTEAGNYATTTGGDGHCLITIPNSIALPPYTIVTVDHSSIKPYALSVSGSANTNSSSPISCQGAPANVKGRWVTLHHLGDDNYSGSENSQLQLPTEGLFIEYHFNLSSIPSAMPYLQIYARGVQHSTAILINGHGVSNLGVSASNGNLSSYDYQLHTNGTSLNQIFKIGDNVLRIHTAQFSNSDWDDIEFCGVLLYN